MEPHLNLTTSVLKLQKIMAWHSVFQTVPLMLLPVLELSVEIETFDCSSSPVFCWWSTFKIPSNINRNLVCPAFRVWSSLFSHLILQFCFKVFFSLIWCIIIFISDNISLLNHFLIMLLILLY
jgi:hypothetical protein